MLLRYERPLLYGWMATAGKLRARVAGSPVHCAVAWIVGLSGLIRQYPRLRGIDLLSVWKLIPPFTVEALPYPSSLGRGITQRDSWGRWANAACNVFG
jgi:hypothetical protein